ncbi:MAG: hypothetical protein K0R48_1301 [Gammaproteobacteria bacterium]|nr:hypothetical protein [Gammaproteobacteria bacterium]
MKKYFEHFILGIIIEIDVDPTDSILEVIRKLNNVLPDEFK